MLCLHILPLDNFNNKQKCEKVSTIDQLLILLEKSPGNPDKPVRLLLEENGAAIVAKFDIKTSRNESIEDELTNLRTLSTCSISLILERYVALVRWGGSTSRGSVLCTDYIKPYRDITTLRQLATCQDEMTWKSVLFQTLYALALLQKEFEGFRHNDFKGDNVLVTDLKEEFVFAIDTRKTDRIVPPLRMRRTWKIPSIAQPKIIDLELATTPNGKIKSRAILNSSESFRADFGLCSERCDVFDVHLLLYDTINAASASKSPIEKDLRVFALSFFPSELFLPHNLTSQCRLKIQDQKKLQSKLGNYALISMMSHPYFFDLRGESTDHSDYSIII
jgi:hypothetical protein